MNKELCELQNAAVAAFQATLAEAAPAASSAPVTIMHANVASALSTLHDADVIVRHTNRGFPP
jgi:hypothetical protein